MKKIYKLTRYYDSGSLGSNYDNESSWNCVSIEIAKEIALADFANYKRKYIVTWKKQKDGRLTSTDLGSLYYEIKKEQLY